MDEEMAEDVLAQTKAALEERQLRKRHAIAGREVKVALSDGEGEGRRVSDGTTQRQRQRPLPCLAQPRGRRTRLSPPRQGHDRQK